MAGACLEKLPHSCGTRRGLQVYAKEDGSVDGYCWSCRTYVRHPYGDEKKVEDLPKPKIKTQEEIEAEIAEIDGYPTVDIKKKRLKASALEKFGVKVGLSEEDGVTPEMLCYPYTKDGQLVGYKVKLLEGKRFWSLGDLKDCDLFGWEQALQQGAKRLIITEGEDDAVAFKRALELHGDPKYLDWTAFVSLPSGVHSAKDFLAKHYNKIQRHFQEISICFDMDKQGREAVEEVCTVCPGITSIDVPGKDANDCLINGKGNALAKSIFKAAAPKNTRLIMGSSLVKKAMEPPHYGELTWPWDHLNEATRAIRYGETIYIGAGVKMGKSEVVNALAAHFIKNHNVKVMMAKLEENPENSYKLLAGKIAGKIFHDPTVAFNEKDFIAASKIIDDNAIFVDCYQQAGWETLKADIIASASLGVKAVFIDPITNLTVGMDSGDVNTKLVEIAVELAGLAKDLDIVIFIFCHLKAHNGIIPKEARDKYYREGRYVGLGNCPHELGGDIYSSQFAGSRAMMRSCHMMIGLEGNKDPELEDRIKNIRNLKILEDRTFGVSGVFPVYWNKNNTLFEEM